MNFDINKFQKEKDNKDKGEKMKLPPEEWRKIMEQEKEKRKKQLEEEKEKKRLEREREKAENKAKREEERAVKKIERDKVRATMFHFEIDLDELSWQHKELFVSFSFPRHHHEMLLILHANYFKRKIH